MNELPTPLPTLYDITPIPVFAYVPGILAWIVVLGIGIIVIYLLRRSGEVSNSGIRLKALSLLRTDLARLKKQLGSSRILDRAEAGRLSSLVRSYLAVVTEYNVTSMSSHELETLSKKLPPSSLSKLVVALSTLECSRFSPDIAITTEVLGELETLVLALELEQPQAVKGAEKA